MPETTQKPEAKPQTVTVGRIVMYEPAPWQARTAAGPWPAIVTAVTENDTVTLAVLPPKPTPVGTDPVQRHEGVKQGTEPGTWRWPERV